MSLIKAIGLPAVALAALALAGCGSAPIPLAKNFEQTSQHKVRSAGHWELVSRDVVAQTRATLAQVGYGQEAPLHVALPHNPSAFDLAFRDFLITEMVQGGSIVHQQPGAGLEVNYHAQLVRHNSDRPHFIPGQYTMIAAGLMAAYGLRHQHIDAQLLATLGLTAAADYASSINSGGPTNTEMVLTTTVTRGGQYIARKTDVYYLENADVPLFLRPLPLPQPYRPMTMQVVSQ
ncbi:hypothetical protein SAMN05428957_102393 [Oryzisolibacter propanilivorax]|uniref:Lipoprotein n=1 Tax=Oryzisolibacter propanilivorax TaxID=1527607 RepID=A0A1G9QKJ3_9BURK|nr:hypothetical protein [Oryzisolibacter propanilivorax]SDM11554.1 hypothetical protein SAMN05428957_102393 [Oryzisolibacter propanilivorax]